MKERVKKEQIARHRPGRGNGCAVLGQKRPAATDLFLHFKLLKGGSRRLNSPFHLEIFQKDMQKRVIPRQSKQMKVNNIFQS